MKKKEMREVEVQSCDVCQTEVTHLTQCAICKRDLCSGDGGSKHFAWSVEIFRYRDSNRGNLHTCKDCNERKTSLSIGELLDAMLGREPIQM